MMEGITNMYKIFILVKEDNVKPLWSPIMTKVTNPDGTTEYVEYSTEDSSQLEQKLTELIEVGGSDKIRVVSDVDYNIDISVS